MANLTTYNNSIIHFKNYSSLTKLKRTFAYLLRFIHNTRNAQKRITSSLSADELKAAFIHLCRLSQRESFLPEYDLFACKRSLSPKSLILSLTQFFGDDHAIRVGGRLGASDFNFDKKHPVLLHSMHHFTKILFEHEHKQNFATAIISYHSKICVAYKW